MIPAVSNRHPEAHTTEEEWAGITSQPLRKRLQNRLNQRALRRRRALQKAQDENATPPQNKALALRSQVDDEAKSLSKNLPDLYASQMTLNHAMTSALGQGRIDPFNVHSVQEASFYVSEVLDHAMVHTWPGVSPAPPKVDNPVKRAWLHCALNSPMAFYSLIFAAGTHHNFLHNDTDPQSRSALLSLSYKTQAISLINEQLSELKSDPTDALIISILVLAAHGTKIDPDKNLGPIHPLSPLAKTQNLDFYASLEFGDQHMKAMNHLIIQKGGLDSLELYGLRDTIAFADILHASLKTVHPKFSLRWSLPEPIASLDLREVPKSGFNALTESEEHDSLFQIIRLGRLVTEALEVCTRGGQSSITLFELIQARNVFQHRLLSLPVEDGAESEENTIYEVTRLAAIIYSDMVLFPLPYVSSPKPRLANVLREALECCTLHDCWEDYTPLLLWAITLGGTAALRTKDREWYVDKMKDCVKLLGFREWRVCLAMLKDHLWWDDVCKSPAQRLWEEAMGRPKPSNL